MLVFVSVFEKDCHADTKGIDPFKNYYLFMLFLTIQGNVFGLTLRKQCF